MKQPTAKKKPSQATKPTLAAKLARVPCFLKRHKLVTFLSVLLLLYPIGYLQAAYKDWDNAQLIKGLARDFPLLVKDIESATGLDLDMKIDCMITTEKLGSGVRTCEMSVGYVGLQNSEEIIMPILKKSSGFHDFIASGSGVGYKVNYRNKQACSLWFTSVDRLHVECLTAVREKNIQLAKDLFTQVKNEQK